MYYRAAQYTTDYTFNSCNVGTSVLPDTCTQILRATGPRDERWTYQAEHECTYYNYYITPLCTNRGWASAKQLKPNVK